MPKFSVIVPVYNVEEFLEECVKSVLNQSFEDFELILVDDGSTDKSPEICDMLEKADSRIKVFHNSNGGASAARNCGLEAATGEFVIFLDSDDYWNQKDGLALLSSQIEKNNADIVLFGCTDFSNVSGESYVSRTGYNLDIIESGDKNETLHYLLSSKMIPGGPTIFCFRKSLAELNGIRFKEGISNEDYDFVLSVFTESKRICAVNDPFYTYRHSREGSVTGSANIKMIYGIDYTVNKWYPIINGFENETLKRDYLNYLAFIYSTGFVIAGRMDRNARKEALSILKKNRKVLRFGYWKRTKVKRIGLMLLGANLFSVLGAKYFDRTHY